VFWSLGTITLLDSLQAAAAKAIVCNTGIIGNEWTIKNFEPLVDIPSTVKLTVYNSETIQTTQLLIVQKL
jgi:NADPH:quinone reductase